MADSTLRGQSLWDTITDTHPPDVPGDRASGDRWIAEDDDEACKCDETLAMLPRARYRAAFEVGCSIRALTRRLAERCDSLVAVDCSPMSDVRPRAHHADQPPFQRMSRAGPYPAGGSFDLVLLSEVAYYWTRRELRWAFDRIVEQVRPEGHLLLVHWAPPGPDRPLSGIEVHGAFMEWAKPEFMHLLGRHEGPYFIDLFERCARTSVSRLQSTRRNKADGDSTKPHDA